MSEVSQDKRCDCCGKIIPAALNKMDYSGYTSYIESHFASNAGNKQFFNHHPFDMIHGMVIFNIRREPEAHSETVVPSQGFDGARLHDICPECKINFLKLAIDYIKHHDIDNDYNELFDNLSED